MSLIMSASTPTSTPNVSLSPTPSPINSPSQSPTPITGLSVFWPLFTLALASCFHALGSGLISPSHYSPKYRYYLRALPLSGLLDSLCFLQQSIQHDALTIVIARLRENEAEVRLIIPPAPDLPDMDEGLREGLQLEEPPYIGALERYLDSAFNMRIRLFPNAFILLAYAKLCTYDGISWSLTWGTIYFVSWLVLEIVLLIQHFRRWGASERERQERLKEAVRRVLDGSHRGSNKLVEAFAWLVILGQVVTLFAIVLAGVVHGRSRPPRPPNRAPFFQRLDTFLHRSVDWVLAPSDATMTWAGQQVLKVFGILITLHIVPAILYLLFIIIYCVILLIIVSVVFLACITFYAAATTVGVVGICASIVLPIMGLYSLYQQYRSKSLLPYLLHPRSFIVLAFLLLASSMFYYTKLFDPTGTSKRPWSETLP